MWFPSIHRSVCWADTTTTCFIPSLLCNPRPYDYSDCSAYTERHSWGLFSNKIKYGRTRAKYWHHQAFQNSLGFMWEIRTLSIPQQHSKSLSSPNWRTERENMHLEVGSEAMWPGLGYSRKLYFNTKNVKGSFTYHTSRLMEWVLHIIFLSSNRTLHILALKKIHWCRFST